jgi:hypothetical protein
VDAAPERGPEVLAEDAHPVPAEAVHLDAVDFLHGGEFRSAAAHGVLSTSQRTIIGMNPDHPAGFRCVLSADDPAATVLWTCGDDSAWLASWQFKSDAWVARSVDGSTWDGPFPIDAVPDTEQEFEGSPTIVSTGARQWVAAWTSWVGGLSDMTSTVLVARSVDGGRSWTAGLPLQPDAGLAPATSRTPPWLPRPTAVCSSPGSPGGPPTGRVSTATSWSRSWRPPEPRRCARPQTGREPQ